MASISSGTRRLFFLRHLILVASLPACTGLPEAEVFQSKPEASVFLHRTRRANFLFEELKAGNLERECLEERCSYEEAKEIFALPQQLEAFWRKYTAVDHCQSSPCKNGATCTRLVSTYICKCAPGYHGHDCDKARITTRGCRYKNGGCEHFCREFPDRSQVCFCAPGYSLQRDNSTCQPSDPDAVVCGKPRTVFTPRVVRGQSCPRGHCPWQALLTRNQNYQCGAIVLSDQWILTAAHCVWKRPTSSFQVVVGEHLLDVVENTEQLRQVVKVVIHQNYNTTNYDTDLAMLKLDRPVDLGTFVVPICLPARNSTFTRTIENIRRSTVSGWGRLSAQGPPSNVLQRLELPRVHLQECRLHTKLTVTKNMLCAGHRTGGQDACQGDSGGPLVTRYKRTWFLTGVVSWGKGCGGENLYGIYARVSAFLAWIEDVMSRG